MIIVLFSYEIDSFFYRYSHLSHVITCTNPLWSIHKCHNNNNNNNKKEKKNG